jgi:gluconate kinase
MTKTTQQIALEDSDLWKLYEAIEDGVADMTNLGRHAEFVQVSAVRRTLEALLNKAREANAEFVRDRI